MSGGETGGWSAVIVAYNSAADITGCVESLLRQRGVPAGKIVIVDNASTDGTPELITRKFPGVTLIENDFNRGFAAGNNLGFSQASGEFYLVINPDAAAEPDCVKALFQYLESTPGSVCVGPAIVNSQGVRQVSFFPFTNLWWSLWAACGIHRILPFNRLNGRLGVLYRPPDRTVEVDRLLGAAMMVRSEWWRKVGGFDERFFLYSEEEDFCLRLCQAGGRVNYHPLARVIHRGAGSTGCDHPLMVAAATWSRHLFIMKHRPAWEAEVSRWAWILGLTVRYAAAGCRYLLGGRDRRAGYREALRCLLAPGYFDQRLRPGRVDSDGAPA